MLAGIFNENYIELILIIKVLLVYHSFFLNRTHVKLLNNSAKIGIRPSTNS